MKVAAYTASRNLYKDMIPAVNSLLAHSDVDVVYFLIEDDEFPYPLSEKVECINISQQTYFPKDSANYSNRFTYLVLIRAAFAKIFPYDKILSLDVDTIVDKDISDIWDLPVDDYYFSAALEPYCSKGGVYEKMDEYYNVGVTLYNLKKLRDDGKVDEVIKALNEVPYDFLEQDCFNRLCEGHILEMPSDYNACEWTKPTGNPKIVHYAGIKEWNHFPLINKYRY